jgi:protein-disulfide isomerase
MSEDVLSQLQADAHYKGDAQAKITWLEYTDVNCHYCKKMESDGTAAAVMASIGADLNKTSSNFIGVGGQASQVAAEILECAASLSGSDAYNTILSETLISGDNSRATLVASAVTAGIDEVGLNACIDNGDAKETVARKFARGQTAFGITGTP